MSKPRDIHFQGFAKLLWPEIHDELAAHLEQNLYVHREAVNAIEDLIARRAYDLVYFAFREMRHEINDYYDPLDALRDTPDLTELPPTE